MKGTGEIIDTTQFNESELMDAVMRVVSETCDVTIDGLLHSRAMPYPTCRGLCWYALRQITGMTYSRMTDILHSKGSVFTCQSVCGTSSKAVELISKTAYWRQQWNVIKRRLDIQKKDADEQPIEIRVELPKEARNKVKIKIIEK